MIINTAFSFLLLISFLYVQPQALESFVTSKPSTMPDLNLNQNSSLKESTRLIKELQTIRVHNVTRRNSKISVVQTETAEIDIIQAQVKYWEKAYLGASEP